MIPDFKTYIGESTWGKILDRGSGDSIRTEDKVKTNEELKEIIKNLYAEQGSGDTFDVTSIALGKKYICDDLSDLFNGYVKIKRIIGLETWDVSSVTDMNYMFCNCRNLTELNIDTWNVSNVTSMHSMFISCETLTELNIDNWDVSKVTDMNYMFSYCEKLTELNIDNWDVSKVTDMRDIFFCCKNLTEKPKWYEK